MARADRGMAQRYAAKRRKRRQLGARPVPVGGPAVGTTPEDRPGAEDSDLLEAPPVDPALVARPGVPTVRVTGTPARQRPAARPFSDYAQEYSYVVNDLRRVAVVGGGLLLALIVLALFVR
jgi:hypothetical protein